jgi:hypothetical protein
VRPSARTIASVAAGEISGSEVERSRLVSASAANGESEVGAESPSSDHEDTPEEFSDDTGIGERVVEVTAGAATGVDDAETAGALDVALGDGTVLDDTGPDDTGPDDTGPDDTEPDDTEPDDTEPDGADAATGLLEANGSEEPKSKAPVKMPTTRATAMEEAMPRAARE